MQYRLARVRFMKTIRVPNVFGHWAEFREGEIRTMQAWHDRPGMWWSDSDIDAAFIVPAGLVEVVQDIAPGELP